MLVSNTKDQRFTGVIGILYETSVTCSTSLHGEAKTKRPEVCNFITRNAKPRSRAIVAAVAAEC